MDVTAYKTRLVQLGDDIETVLTEALPQTLPERSIVVLASKLFSTCENCVVPKTTEDKQEKHDLAKQEAEWYLDPHSSKYHLMLTIKRNWMFANAGIDESNIEGHYILWPRDPQVSLNRVWQFLRRHYGVRELGVTMSDSSSIPLNWGVTGHSIAYCGFNPLRSYIGQPDLFGRIMKMEQTNIAQSITAIASVEMGEGAEQTPVAVVSNITNVQFQDHVPTQAELDLLKIELENDMFAPLLTVAKWQKGGGGVKLPVAKS